MEIGLREWLVIGGVMLIALIILDGWRRMQGNRRRLRMDIDPAAADLPDEPVRSFNPELPNGGARVKGDDLLSTEFPHEGSAGSPIDAHIDANDNSPERVAGRPELDASGAEASSDSLLAEPPLNDNDPLFSSNDSYDELLGPARVVFEDSEPVEGSTRIDEDKGAVKQYEEISEPVWEDDGPSLPEAGIPEVEVSRIPPLFASENMPHTAPEPDVSPPSEVQPFTGDANDEFKRVSEPSFDLEEVFEAADALLPEAEDAPEGILKPVSDDAFSIRVHKKVPVVTELPQSDDSSDIDLDKPIPLFFDEPEVNKTRLPPEPLFPSQGFTASPAGRVTETQNAATEDLFAGRPALEKTPDPASVLIVTVLASEQAEIPGSQLLPLVSACGMCFGDMNIFHRFEDGVNDGAVQFSMANAVNPGVFDLKTMSEMSTRGLTFFMSMEEPRDVMNAFECMLATAETVARHMGAELLDEERSVLRPQTKEHYRQRIRDFEMRNLPRRAH